MPKQQGAKNLPGLNKNVLHTAKDVHDMCAAHFSSAEWRAKAKATARKVQNIVFLLSSIDPKIDPVPRYSPEAFEPMLDGISHTYQYHLIERGLVDARKGPCWCLPCLVSIIERESVTNGIESHYPKGCRSARRKCVAPNPKFEFIRQACIKVTGRDRGNMIELNRKSNAAKRAMCSQLTANDWVLFRSKDMDEKLWLGRAVQRDSWDQKATWQNDTMRRVSTVEMTDGIPVDAGECAVFVQWYDFVRSGEYGREYIVSGPPHNTPIVQNFKDLVAAQFDDCVHQIMGGIGSRRSMRRQYVRVQGLGPDPRPYAKVLCSSMTTHAEAYQNERGRRYELEHKAHGAAVKALDKMSSK